jgi:hypothetical protein
MNNVLLVADHPDDEVLGCGGTTARLADAGDQVEVRADRGRERHPRQQQRDSEQVTYELSSLVKAAQQAGAILGGQ